MRKSKNQNQEIEELIKLVLQKENAYKESLIWKDKVSVNILAKETKELDKKISSRVKKKYNRYEA